MAQERIPAMLVRGGTSNGVYFERSDMPRDERQWDDFLCRSFGSPDPMQLDGVGGSHSVTSKTMIVSAAAEPGIDVEYEFGQVGIDEPIVDWGGNCGNLTYGVGPFALERELVDGTPDDDRVDLTLRNANTDAIVAQSVPVAADGSPRYGGEFRISGVPRPGARIRSRFRDPGGSTTGRLLPTGNRIDGLDVTDVGPIDATLLDVTNPCVFVRAADVGLTAAELPATIDGDSTALDRIERIRSAACARLGIVPDETRASEESPGIPKIALVGERERYNTVAGDTVESEEYDLLARIMSMGRAHHAYAVTGAMCTAVAALLPGTIPSEFLETDASDAVRIGHPKGTLSVGVGMDGTAVEYTAVDRTARPIFDGTLYDPGPVAWESARSADGSPSRGDSA